LKKIKKVFQIIAILVTMFIFGLAVLGANVAKDFRNFMFERCIK